MKQKIIYIVLLTAGIYIPASSRECGKVITTGLNATAAVLANKPAIAEEPASNLPVSLFSKLLFKM